MIESIRMNNINTSEIQSGIEPDFIAQLREKAKLTLLKKGIPNSHEEDWKYTPIHRYFPTGESRISSDSSLIDHPFSSLDSFKIMVVNGEFKPELSDTHLPKELEIHSLENAFNKPAFKTYFNQMGKEREDYFTQLNNADFDRGLFIYLKKNSQLSKPLHIIHVYEGKDSRIQNSRNLILLEALSELTLLESYISKESKEQSVDIFSNDISEYFLERGSKLDNIKYQSLGKETRLVNTQLVDIHQHAEYKSHTYSLSGQLIRNNIQINLSESESEAHLYGFYSLHNQELVDNHTLVKHLKPFCQSNELYKGVLDGKSIGVFNGRVEVSQDAQKTNAYQQNQTILLSKEASMNSKPELEIFADDVKCSHGSTMGQLDTGALFYLQSRGISEKTAQKIMINAFAFSLLSEIAHEDIAFEIGEKIQFLNA